MASVSDEPPPGTEDAAPDPSQREELRAALGQALLELGIQSADPDASEMLEYAACLYPDDGEPAISTTRLFIGAAVAGREAPNSTLGVPTYATALAASIVSDSELGASYRKNIVPLFRFQPPVAALERLGSRWFSHNVTKILLRAAETTSDGLLHGDAIVQALLDNGAGLIFGRINMPRLAAAIAALRGPPRTSPPDPPRPTIEDEVAAALAVLSIRTTDHLRSRIAAAASFREPGDALQPIQLLWSLFEPGNMILSARLPTDPSMMLYETLQRTVPPVLPVAPAKPPLVANLQEADPSNPLRFAPATSALLSRAYRKQQQVFLNAALGTKGLVASLLTMQPEEIGQDHMLAAVDFAELRASFSAVARDRLSGQLQLLQQWNRALEFESVSLPKLNNDQPWAGEARDHLEITNDALAIANVAAASSTSLPLAFGIFGDWGAGKTFFMRLIHQQIAQVVHSTGSNDGFEHAIVQIQFNAWHYAETNLWASLVGHIFDELDRWMTRDEAGTPTQADDILKRLATSRQLALETATELVQRRKDHANASQKLAEAQQELSVVQDKVAHAPVTAWQAALRITRDAVLGDPELKEQLGSMTATLGVAELLEDKTKLAAALDEFKHSVSAGSASLSALRATAGDCGTLFLAITALLGIPVALFALRALIATVPGWSDFADISHGIEAVGGVLATAAVVLRGFSARLRRTTEKFTHLRGAIDAEINRASVTEQANVSAATDELAKTTAAVEQAKTVLQATGEQVAMAVRDYAEETSGLRIARFVRARAGNDGYGRHLGLVSTIRKDFEQLESLMLDRGTPSPQLEDMRKHYETRVNALVDDAGTALTKEEKTQLLALTQSMQSVGIPDTMQFRRIVLYIDDLDRCEPHKVVQVLQAVNMLLSFRLFVVIVAVDARWLARSLETVYPEFFGNLMAENAPGHSDARDPSLDAESAVRATAADYLEKIFQVPYWVPPMTEKTSARLVGDLVAADHRPDLNPRAPDAIIPVQQQTSQSGLGDPATMPAEDAQAQTPAPPIFALSLTTQEVNALRALAPFLGGSPRRARRFVNIYRVAKASLGAADLKRLEDGEYRALAAQLAIATGAPNAFSAWVAACNDTTDKTLAEKLLELAVPETEKSNFEGAMAWFTKPANSGAHRLLDLAAQAPRAARFSFAAPARPRTVPWATAGQG